MAKANRLQTLLERQEARKTIASLAAAPLFLELYKKMLTEGLNEVCRCGRAYMINSVPHCPNCGTTNVYGFSTAGGERMLPNTEKCVARGYRCRRCTLTFSDVDTFLHCEAQEPQKTMKEVRQEEKATNILQKAGFEGIDDFRDRLLALREKRLGKEEK